MVKDTIIVVIFIAGVANAITVVVGTVVVYIK